MNGRLLCICYGSLDVLLEGIMGLMVASDFATRRRRNAKDDGRNTKSHERRKRQRKKNWSRQQTNEEGERQRKSGEGLERRWRTGIWRWRAFYVFFQPWLNYALLQPVSKVQLTRTHQEMRQRTWTFTQCAPEATGIRWNSAKLLPLRRSRSFKVTDFGTNRKLMCDFGLPISD